MAPVTPEPPGIYSFEQLMDLLHQKGFIFRTHDLKELERVLRAEGYAVEASRVAQLE